VPLSRVDLQTLLFMGSRANVQFSVDAECTTLDVEKLPLANSEQKLIAGKNRDSLRSSLYEFALLSGDPHQYLEQIEATISSQKIESPEDSLMLAQCLSDVQQWFSKSDK